MAAGVSEGGKRESDDECDRGRRRPPEGGTTNPPAADRAGGRGSVAALRRFVVPPSGGPSEGEPSVRCQVPGVQCRARVLGHRCPVFRPFPIAPRGPFVGLFAFPICGHRRNLRSGFLVPGSRFQVPGSRFQELTSDRWASPSAVGLARSVERPVQGAGPGEGPASAPRGAGTQHVVWKRVCEGFHNVRTGAPPESDSARSPEGERRGRRRP